MSIHETLSTIFSAMTTEFEAVNDAADLNLPGYIIMLIPGLAVTTKDGGYRLGKVSKAFIFKTLNHANWVIDRMLTQYPSASFVAKLATQGFIDYTEQLNCNLENALYLARKNGVKFP